jgi:RNA polymerase sigma factor (sigma-70 family)
MQKVVNTDYLLWKRIKAGETQAYHELYEQYSEILFSFGFIYSKDKELLKDCIHDLFIDLHRYRKNLSDNNNIRNYLFKSLKRKILSSKKGKLSLVYIADVKEVNQNTSSLFDEDYSEEQKENITKIQKAIDKLSIRQQEALNLRFQLDLPYIEVAKIMEISLESVRTLVYRSVKMIRKDMNIKSKQLVLFFLQTSY